MKEPIVKIGLGQAIKLFWSAAEHHNTIETFSNRRVDFLNVDVASICIDDIAQGVSNTCRFAGQIKNFYSVAEHSVLVSLLVEHLMPVSIPGMAQAALMHDAAEAYIGDVTTPLKVLCPGFQMVESEIESVIQEAFGIEISFSHPMVKDADHMMFRIERDLFKGVPREARSVFLPAGLRIRNLDPREARKLFIDRVEELGIQKVAS